jgi:hypothetical protein
MACGHAGTPLRDAHYLHVIQQGFMSEIFKRNSINMAISSISILFAYYLGLGGVLFWIGGLLVIPAFAIWFQFKFAFGHFIQRISVAVAPWLVLCCLGLFWASKTEHKGERKMNMLFFEMPLYSALVGCIVLTTWYLIKRLRS